MPARLTGWPAAVLAVLVTLALVAGELTHAGQRRWWAARPLTTDTVSGLLVLLVTVLVVNHLLTRRQARQRGHAVAAQAAIIVAQAARSAGAVSSVTGGPGDRGTASDGFRTYTIMLLISAPVLIGDPVARRFLEQAQYLGAVMAAALTAIDRSPDGATVPGDGLDDAVQQLQRTAAPLLQLLSPAIRDSIQNIGQTAEEQGRAGTAGSKACPAELESGTKQGRLRRERQEIRCLGRHLACRAGVHPSPTSATLADHLQLGSWHEFADAHLPESQLPPRHIGVGGAGPWPARAARGIHPGVQRGAEPRPAPRWRRAGPGVNQHRLRLAMTASLGVRKGIPWVSRL